MLILISISISGYPVINININHITNISIINYINNSNDTNSNNNKNLAIRHSAHHSRHHHHGCRHPNLLADLLAAIVCCLHR